MEQSARRAAQVAGWDTARARDGTPLAWRLAPGGPGRCVLIHSLAMDGAFWDRVVPRLQDRAAVLVYDCRGHGRSGKPPGPYSTDLFADDLADLLDAVGWRSAVVAGSSMGGCVALAFAAACPERTDGLALIDTTAWYGPEAVPTWEGRARKALDEGMASLVGFQTSRWFTDGFRAAEPATVEATVATFLANDPVPYAEACRMLGRADLRSALPSLRTPCRILVGAEDYATPVEMARAMAEAVAGSTLRIVERARHFTPIEVPDAVAAEIAALLPGGEPAR